MEENVIIAPGSCWPVESPPIVIVGPTATGKTAAAVELAERLNGEIVSADSMQVYRGMEIGTAKPDAGARSRVPFHLLDIRDPDQPFNVAEWADLAVAAVSEISSRGRPAIVCGGTGMYVRALLEGWSLAGTPPDPEARRQLNAELAAKGAPTLHARLEHEVPEAAARIHPNDGIRIVRALEVYLATGRSISSLQESDRGASRRRPARQFGLTMPRPTLYSRIEERVESMLSAGLEAEVRDLLGRGYSPTLGPLRSLGYKEMVAYLSGELDLAAAIQMIKQNTRRFAKRQQTWFRPDASIVWIDVSNMSSAAVATRILE